MFWENTSLVLLESFSKMVNVVLQQNIIHIPRINFCYIGPFSLNLAPAIPYETFAIINTKPSIMQGEQKETIAKSRHKMFFAHSLGCEKYSFP